MELEFDKEIDAILRKAQAGLGVSASDRPNHLDADTIAAFVENAIPEKAKLHYMEHFADCDRCRKQLSFAISMNAGAEQESAQVISAPIAETIVLPWYQKLFRSQNLAIAMGALVLSFGGLIGYLALQNKSGSSSSDVAMEKAPAASEPFSTGTAANTAVKNSSNAAAPSANTSSSDADVVANPNATPLSSVLNQPANSLGRIEPSKELPRSDRDKNVAIDADSADTTSTVAGSAPVPPPALAPQGVAKSKSELSSSKDEESVVAESKEPDDRMRSQDPRPKTPAKKNAGPSRSAVSAQQQEYVLQNSTILGNSSTRRAAGRTFDNRNGVWYDIAYNGQSTKNYRRGTTEYNKLDSGLRNIADSISGTVVIVWKNKAYRIQ